MKREHLQVNLKINGINTGSVSCHHVQFENIVIKNEDYIYISFIVFDKFLDENNPYSKVVYSLVVSSYNYSNQYADENMTYAKLLKMEID
jgi:disulfide oxidoreductase YuzD